LPRWIIGTAAEMSVMSYLKQNAVPQLFVALVHFVEPTKAFPTSRALSRATSLRARSSLVISSSIIQLTPLASLVKTTTWALMACSRAGWRDHDSSADNLTYNAADAITGSTSDLVADVSALAANMFPSSWCSRCRIHGRDTCDCAPIGLFAQWIISSVDRTR